MDKEQLKQIRYVDSEILVIEKQIDDLEPTTLKDKVSGSLSSFPYIATNFNITGIDVEDYDKRTRILRNRLMKKKKELLELKEEAQKFIDGIDDSLTRQIITLRYIKGYTWAQIAKEVRGTPDSARMILKRFLENI